MKFLRRDMHYSANAVIGRGCALGMEDAGVCSLIGKCVGKACRSLHDKASMVEKQSAQASEFFAAAGAARAAMKATRHHVAVASVLRADAWVDDHKPTVEIADPEHDTLNELLVSGKN